MQITDPRNGTFVNIRHSEEYWAEISAAKTCVHTSAELRRWTNRDGSRPACEQCLTCGVRVGNPVGGMQSRALADADSSIATGWKAQWIAAVEAIAVKYVDRQHQEDGGWQVEYEAYRQTDAWQAKRGLVLKRCAGVCEGCGTASATEVHHITYEHVFEEFLFELQGLCRSCHERWHASRGPEQPA